MPRGFTVKIWLRHLYICKSFSIIESNLLLFVWKVELYLLYNNISWEDGKGLALGLLRFWGFWAFLGLKPWGRFSYSTKSDYTASITIYNSYSFNTCLSSQSYEMSLYRIGMGGLMLDVRLKYLRRKWLRVADHGWPMRVANIINATLQSIPMSTNNNNDVIITYIA